MAPICGWDPMAGACRGEDAVCMAEDTTHITKRLGRMSHDRRATERWLNEGGRVAPDAVLERERGAEDVHRATTTRDETTAKAQRVSKSPPHSRSARPRVVIAGGGVAGLETLLALHALAGDRVDITLVEPELKFVNRSMAVMQPFKGHRVRGVKMEDIAAEFGVRWLRRNARSSVPRRAHGNHEG